MKILYVNACYYPVNGGVEEYVKSVAERMATKHDVTVFAGDISGRLPKFETINGVTIRRFKSYAPGDSFYFSLEMARELRKVNHDIVHAFNYHALPAYFAQNAKRFLITPCYHGQGHTGLTNYLLKLYRPLGSSMLRKAAMIIANSVYEKGILERDFGLPVIVIPCGLNLTEFQGSASKNSFQVLSVGRLEEYKGMQYVISAMPYLPDYGLQIVGKGSYKPELLALVKKLGLSKKVTFYQDLPRHELLRMYAQAGIFILLSKLESYAITVAEALASHTICIVAESTALSEWVDNINCFGVNYPIQSEQVAELIKRHSGRITKHPDIWDWDMTAQRLEELYRRVNVRERSGIGNALV